MTRATDANDLAAQQGPAAVVQMVATARPVRDIPVAFDVVPVADLGAADVSMPADWWDDYIPAGVVSMLGSHGGVGKTIVALMLAVSTVTGKPLFGVPTRRGVVVLFSGEDRAAVLRHRLQWICRCMNVDPGELADLHILDATITDPALFHEVGKGGAREAKPTRAYAELRDYCDECGANVLIVDNASDAFDGSEIDRSLVRKFMQSLAKLAVPDRGVLLLAHVDKGTSRGERTSTEGYSGSTAWHNSVRSRMFMSRDKEGLLKLEHQKSNFGPMREPLSLQWPTNGLPGPVVPLSGVVQGIVAGNDAKTLLRLIEEFTARGEFVATAQNSPSCAARLLAGQPGYPKRKAAEVQDLLRNAERQGYIERISYRTPDRKSKERWALTAPGRQLVGLPAPSAPSAPSAPFIEDGADSIGTAPSAQSTLRGVWGGGARTPDGAGGQA